MNILDKTVAKIDNWQRNRRFPAFVYSVIKKYGEDQAGYQAALLTYYGFLSLFPLLLVLTTLVGIFGGEQSDVKRIVFDGLNTYFPMFGNQLSGHVQGIQHLHYAGVFANLVHTHTRYHLPGFE